MDTYYETILWLTNSQIKSFKFITFLSLIQRDQHSIIVLVIKTNERIKLSFTEFKDFINLSNLEYWNECNDIHT